MEKVQLPKVNKETRVDLNIIKARRGDKDLNATCRYLIELDAKEMAKKEVE